MKRLTIIKVEQRHFFLAFFLVLFLDRLKRRFGFSCLDGDKHICMLLCADEECLCQLWEYRLRFKVGFNVFFRVLIWTDTFFFFLTSVSDSDSSDSDWLLSDSLSSSSSSDSDSESLLVWTRGLLFLSCFLSSSSLLCSLERKVY